MEKMVANKGMKETRLAALSAEVLKSGNRLRFRAKGGSMYPFVRDGDVLLVEPCSSEDIRIGQVIYYRARWGGMVAHRVTGQERRNGAALLITKGDSCPGADRPIVPGQVLGRVTALERDGKRIPMDRGWQRLAAVFWTPFSAYSPVLYPVFGRIKKTVELPARSLGGALQGSKFYRSFGKRLMAGRVSYRSVAGSDACEIADFYGHSHDPELRAWTPRLHEELGGDNQSLFYPAAYLRGKIVGALALRRFPEGEGVFTGWWIWGLIVRGPYRGLGIGEKLTNMALATATENGAEEVKLLVFETARTAIRLYRKLGFRQFSQPDLEEQLAEEVRQGQSRRIAMVRNCQANGGETK